MIRAAFSFVAAGPRQRAAERGARRRRADGRRLLLRQRRATDRGRAQRVSAEQVLGGDGVDMAFAATLRFPDDVLAHIDCRACRWPARDELEVVGEQGSLFLDDPWHCLEPVIELRRAEGVERIEVERVNSYALEVENLSAAIRGEVEPLLGRDDAMGQARTIEALYAAAERGETVEASG